MVIPSRNEQFLVPTVRDLLAKAAGDVECIVILDGYWPDPPLSDDERVIVLHRGEAQGMRPAINAAVQMSSGEFILKADAHTMWAEGYDAQLKADYLEDNWILVPRRHPLDPENWSIEQRPDHKYPIDCHFLSEPFEKHGDSTPGLHGSEWRARRDARAHLELDTDLTSQGSAWFMSRAHWDRRGPLDSNLYGCFWHEFQELGLTAWLSGGAVMVTKRTSYAHLYKGARYGRGYSTRDMGHEAGTLFTSWFWMTDQPFHGRTRTLQSLIEQFSPVPTWPADLDAAFHRARQTFTNPYAVAA